MGGFYRIHQFAELAGPSPEWRELYRDICAALDDDPASDKAQVLADRWLELEKRAFGGDPEVQTDAPAAWLDRENWPASIKRRITEFGLEEVRKFIAEAVMASRKRYFDADVWNRLNVRNFATYWQDRVDLFADIEAALNEGPASEKGRELLRRWMSHLDALSAGDPGVKAGFIKAWADRRNWFANLRWREEGYSRMTGERFDKVADFIDRSVAA